MKNLGALQILPRLAARQDVNCGHVPRRQIGTACG